MTSTPPAPPRWSALTGKRVLDLSRLLPGPYATSMLADLGADVIKVEDPAGGDLLRFAPPLFDTLNRNKRSIALDLRTDDGRDTFLRLVRTADAVVESFRPGVLDRLGLGFDTLHAINPKLVLCSLTGYGQTGPYAAALDVVGHRKDVGLRLLRERPSRVSTLSVKRASRSTDQSCGIAVDQTPAYRGPRPRTGIGHHPYARRRSGWDRAGREPPPQRPGRTSPWPPRNVAAGDSRHVVPPRERCYGR